MPTNSNSAPAWNNIGSLLSDLGRYEEARAACTRAIELQPVYPEAYVNLGHLSAELGDTVQAESCFRHAIALAPNLAPAHSRLGVLIGRDLARADEALGCLQRALALNPGDADALNAIGNLLLSAKRIEESHAVFRRAQQLAPFVTWRAITEKPAFSTWLCTAWDISPRRPSGRMAEIPIISDWRVTSISLCACAEILPAPTVTAASA